MGNIATSSAGEGLDFACNLLASALEQESCLRPQRAGSLLRTLTQYISFRYAGEDGLAIEHLAYLGGNVGDDVGYRIDQIWRQLAWCATELGIDRARYNGPEAWREARE